MTEDERSAVLDAVALVEAEARGDQLAKAVLLFASDDLAYLRRVLAPWPSCWPGSPTPTTPRS